MKTAQLGIELGTRHLRICTRDKEEFLKIKNKWLLFAKWQTPEDC